MGHFLCIFSLIFQFCGSTIAGLSLLSDSVMRLAKEGATNEWLDLLLPRYSLYILRSTNLVIFVDLAAKCTLLLTQFPI